MSWESSAHYYRELNQRIRKSLGGRHSAPLILWSGDFAQISDLQHQEAWDLLGELLAGAAQQLEGAGADGVIICANTMHKVAGAVREAVSVPLIHLGEVTAQAVEAAGYKRIGLLGTRFTLESSLYRDCFSERDISVLVPDESTGEAIHQIIFDELVCGRVEEDSRRLMLRAITDLSFRGAEAVVLGCTEFGMLVSQADTQVTLFDTTQLHCEASAAWILGDRDFHVGTEEKPDGGIHL